MRPASAALLLVLAAASPLGAANTSGTLAPAAPAANVPHLEVSLQPERVTVGDRVTAMLTLHVPSAPSAPPRFPAWSTTWGPAEIVEKGEPEKSKGADGAVIYRQKLAIAAFAPGRVALPPVEVAVPLSERTVRVHTPDALGFEVASVLPQGTEVLTPKPEAPPQPLPLGSAFWWTFGSMSAAALAAFLLLARRHRPKAAEAGSPYLSPFDELLAGFERVGRETSPVQGHLQLSFALRRYLGRAFQFPAVESTTSEIHRQLQSRRLPAPLVRRTGDLLRACDRVKFAGEEATGAVLQTRLQAGREIAENVRAALEPPPPPPGAPGIPTGAAG